MVVICFSTRDTKLFRKGSFCVYLAKYQLQVSLSHHHLVTYRTASGRDNFIIVSYSTGGPRKKSVLPSGSHPPSYPQYDTAAAAASLRLDCHIMRRRARNGARLCRGRRRGGYFRSLARRRRVPQMLIVPLSHSLNDLFPSLYCR